ncbi:MAG: hypothetical protein K6C34_00065 [Alphaproteobacteria bacterium]|nr:hypothetical protein [Alphaproteobacteria bacterium]
MKKYLLISAMILLPYNNALCLQSISRFMPCFRTHDSDTVELKRLDPIPNVIFPANQSALWNLTEGGAIWDLSSKSLTVGSLIQTLQDNSDGLDQALKTHGGIDLSDNPVLGNAGVNELVYELFTHEIGDLRYVNLSNTGLTSTDQLTEDLLSLLQYFHGKGELRLYQNNGVDLTVQEVEFIAWGAADNSKDFDTKILVDQPPKDEATSDLHDESDKGNCELASPTEWHS